MGNNQGSFPGGTPFQLINDVQHAGIPFHFVKERSRWNAEFMDFYKLLLTNHINMRIFNIVYRNFSQGWLPNPMYKSEWPLLSPPQCGLRPRAGHKAPHRSIPSSRRQNSFRLVYDRFRIGSSDCRSDYCLAVFTLKCLLNCFIRMQLTEPLKQLHGVCTYQNNFATSAGDRSKRECNVILGLL